MKNQKWKIKVFEEGVGQVWGFEPELDVLFRAKTDGY